MKTPRTRQALCLLAGLAISLLMIAQAQAVTPVENEIQKLLTSDGDAGDFFGLSVTLNGDTALIGAWGDDDNGPYSGSAYVFRWDGSNWAQETKLTAADGAAGDMFGWSVDLDGDTAVIGASGDEDNGPNSGSVYVFRWNGSIWAQEAKLNAADGAAFDGFGISVALHGDTALVGADGDSDEGLYTGAAYVFRWNGSTWVQEEKLTAVDGAADDHFGLTVALDDDTVLIGASGDDDNGPYSGSAYVFRWDGSVWVQEAKLTPADGAADDYFGFSVALDGDTALAGADGDSDNGIYSGSAYVFRWDGSTWVQEAKLTATDSTANDHFGLSVALDGDTAVIGASGDDDNGPFSGSVYVFSRSGSAWSESLKLLASDGSAFDQLGYQFRSVDINADTVIAGAPHQDSLGTSAGAAYIFSLLTDDQPPVVSNVLAAPNPVAYNTSFTIMATVDDSTTGDSNIASASYTINGGAAVAMASSDSAFDEATEDVSATIGEGLETGVYKVCVTGTDAAGNVSDEQCTLLAVYDPNAGFVTGGGWINSPEGAYAPDPSLAGKANFGFVAKYKKGANVPTGQTEFHFQTADLNFHSEDCQWLVVTGHKAQFKGTGTINGLGYYGFMITVIDEAQTASTDVDLFRIKIWDIASGNVVYDNQMGSGDDSDPTTAIGGGSIVIHTPKGK